MGAPEPPDGQDQQEPRRQEAATPRREGREEAQVCPYSETGTAEGGSAAGAEQNGRTTCGEED